MKLIPFTKEDFSMIHDFMYPIWHETYDQVIGAEQTDFLIERYFSDNGLEEFQNKGYKYFKVVDETTVGITVIAEKDGDTYLDKLYLLPSSRGKGYASFVFSELLKLGRDVTLNVNQGNARAVACYRKNGFIIDEEEIIELGDGMINRDYKMRLKAENFKL